MKTQAFLLALLATYASSLTYAAEYPSEPTFDMLTVQNKSGGKPLFYPATTEDMVLRVISPNLKNAGISFGTGSSSPFQPTMKRWVIGKDEAPETGSNAGSWYELQWYNDSGTWQGTAYGCVRKDNEYVAGSSAGGCVFNQRTLFENGVLLKGAAESSHRCAVGVRQTLNSCGGGTEIVQISSSECVLINSLHVWLYPSKARLLGLDIWLTSAGSAGQRNITIGFYSDSSCTALIKDHYFTAYEFSPVSDGTMISRMYSNVQIDTSSQDLYAKLITNTGGTNSLVQVTAQGYLD